MQYRRGYLEEEEWRTYRVVLASRLVRDPNARRMWEETAGGWNPHFQVEVDSIIKEPVPKPLKGFN